MSNQHDSETGEFKEGNSLASRHSAGGAPKGNQNAVGNSGGSPPEGNTNALKHGCYTSPERVWEDLSADEKAFVGTLFSDYLAIAAFDKADARAERLAMTCILCCIERRAMARVLADDMTQQQEVTDANGEHVGFVEREHTLSKEQARINNTIRHNLRELGLIGPRSDLVDTGDDGAGLTLAEWLSSGNATDDETGDDE